MRFYFYSIGRLDELERDFNLIQEHLQGEISNLKSKLQRLSKSIDDTKTLIQVQVILQSGSTQLNINLGCRNTKLYNKRQQKQRCYQSNQTESQNN